MQRYTQCTNMLAQLGNTMSICEIHHVQLAMPKGQEKAAIAFYQGVLGLRQMPKPPILAARGGVWFEEGTVRVHLGVETDFLPARKAHPAFGVAGVVRFLEHLEATGIEVTRDDKLPGFTRGYVEDPFGNRIELLEQIV